MGQQEFEDRLRFFLRREPFQPFVVELLDGRTLTVDERALSFDGGHASFLTPDYELVLFRFADVREFRELIPEMSS